MRGGLFSLVLSAATLFCAPVMAQHSAQILTFDDLDGWAEDDHEAALAVFVNTCPDMEDGEWLRLCAVAQQEPNARTFFELFFRPVLIGGEETALFTGYFEPELQGSRTPTDRFRYPVYRMPPDVVEPWHTRREIEEDGLLEGQGLEIAWVDDPVELFFLQIQGSGRIVLPNGRVIRVGYAGRNGHEYRSIGQELVRRGVYQPHQVSAQVIAAWVRRNPVAGRELLFHNPSYVFFREIRTRNPDDGPLGAMNRSITPMRSIAVDPRFTPLGAPVWIEKDGETPLRRLMIAQDTGSAIQGAQRADIFYGFGDDAGLEAGRIRDPGRMIVLMPIELANQMVPDA